MNYLILENPMFDFINLFRKLDIKNFKPHPKNIRIWLDVIAYQKHTQISTKSDSVGAYIFITSWGSSFHTSNSMSNYDEHTGGENLKKDWLV